MTDTTKKARKGEVGQLGYDKLQICVFKFGCEYQIGEELRSVF